MQTLHKKEQQQLPHLTLRDKKQKKTLKTCHQGRTILHLNLSYLFP